MNRQKGKKKTLNQGQRNNAFCLSFHTLITFMERKYDLTSALTAFLAISVLIGFSAFIPVNAETTSSIHQAVESTNALKNNLSPYLAMHASDPIDWQPWGQAALDKAKTENKMIFLSSGYYACHWCHVMQQENFTDPMIAKMLNQHFISIKIDRELNPEIDQYMIQFSTQSKGVAGWPQHVFATPEGYPFYAFVYLNNARLRQLLNNTQTLWQTQSQSISQQAKKFALKKPKTTQPILFNKALIWQQQQQDLHHYADTMSGGLNKTAKFPNAPILKTFLKQPSLTESSKDWLITTLEAMQSQKNHLFDHVNGGFYRYTVDPEWQMPHFEKMLYTQALLTNIYFLAAKKYQRPDFASTAFKTLKYAETHLYNPTTQLFLGSQSAIDAHHIEGGNYLFSTEELKQKLSVNEFKQVQKDWSVNSAPPYENGWHPKPTLKYWLDIRQLLQTPPEEIPTDTKSILGWNGLMLSAYSAAYQYQPSKATAQKAKQLAQTLLKLLQQSIPPRSLTLEGTDTGLANIQDYAYSIQGLEDWQAASGQDFTTTIQSLRNTAKNKFLSPQGWQTEVSARLPGQRGVWVMPDNALPSPTAILNCPKPKQALKGIENILKSPLNYLSYLSCQATH